ncbi:type II CRISPR RNA-guided endonuclease Cas9 [uncultured Ilyobacter sp.]|uniref:type II CRISPR RNA-guided endonuclease Cas9 n=1 Tax=uncultured Ilyobacter sp. TaxID=544433 RepID=UPI0029F55046|nr:type II CRISPR RNA-guided endonuclease Cas9 [uncultured Ilyobacter sp.]
MKYSIGLDIGIASIGWSVVNKDKDRIEDMGVRIFQKAENPKDGSSLASLRREKRGARRRNRRKKHRLERIKHILCESGLIKKKGIEKIYRKPYLESPWELRSRSLESKLSNEELAQILLHIAKRRGFKSLRKTDQNNKETGELLSGIEENRKLLEGKGYLTIGDMVAKDEKFAEHIRNKSGKYILSFSRKLLEEEVRIIQSKQKELGNHKFTDEILEKYIEVFNSQRNFDEGPSEPSPYYSELGQIAKMIGNCTFEPKEKRAAKNTWSGERFVFLQKLNNFRITGLSEKRKLTEEERALIEKEAYSKKEIKYEKLRKLLSLSSDERFGDLNYSQDEKQNEKTEKSKFISLIGNYAIKKLNLSVELKNEIADNTDKLDKIIEVLTFNKSDKTIEANLKKIELNQKDITILMDLEFSGTLNLSLKAIKKILPYLEKGLLYNEACEKADYDFKNNGIKFQRGELLPVINKELIANPVVLRAVSQTRKVVNSIIRKYGIPHTVHVEIARDLAKSYNDRQRIIKENKNREQENEKTKRYLSEEFGIKDVKSKLILKYRLYKEQDGRCAYSRKKMDLNDVILDESMTDIDHIIPYSRSVDDSYNNKVLVLASENRKKSNLLPKEYFDRQGRDWDTFVLMVKAMKLHPRKKSNLLKEKFTKEDNREWKSRALNDTRYISRFVANYLENGLIYREDSPQQRVYMVPGRLTAQLRARWGLNKVRENGDLHHALDATVVAVTDQKAINNISNISRYKELKNSKDIAPSTEYYTDVETGEIYFEEIKDTKFPIPWNGFSMELQKRLESDNPQEEFYNLLCDRRYLGWFNYEESFIENLKPVFVSRMPSRGIKGQAHQETIRSSKRIDEQITVSKKVLNMIKLKDLENMQGRDTDKRLYESLKKRLEEYKDDPEKAFAEPFYKPTNSGGKGPIVRSIKIEDKQNAGVSVNGGQASNGSMVRIDIFKKNGKFYTVPIYVHQTLYKELPNRAITRKPYKNWDMIDETYEFLYSFYPNDLIKIEFHNSKSIKNENKLTKGEIPEISVDSILAYYRGVDTSTGAATLDTHDGKIQIRPGIKTVKNIEKYQVDILGNLSRVRKEKRRSF